MPELPRSIPLAAGDYFMHGQDRRMRSFGLPGNICRVVLRLGPGLDRCRLKEQITQSPALCWLAQLHVQRAFRVAPPSWKTRFSSEPFFQEHASAGPPGDCVLPDAVLARELHAASGPAYAFDLVCYPSGEHDLVLSWNHALFDARSAELILRHVQSGQNGSDTSFMSSFVHPDQAKGGLEKWWAALRRARQSLPWLKESGKSPLFSLLPKDTPAKGCNNVTRFVDFSSDEVSRMQARCQALNAAFRRSHFYAAAALYAVHALAKRRGHDESAYLIPVPHDTRRRGAPGPVFSNHLSILFYRIEAGMAGRPDLVVEELTKQMMEQIRTGFPVNAMAALELFKPLPLAAYMWQLGKPSGGRFASFCFSDSGETCVGYREVMGAPIQSVRHFVPTWRPPGLTVLFWSFAGKPHALLSYSDDCVSPAEAELLEQTLRAALTREVAE